MEIISFEPNLVIAKIFSVSNTDKFAIFSGSFDSRAGINEFPIYLGLDRNRTKEFDQRESTGIFNWSSFVRIKANEYEQLIGEGKGARGRIFTFLAQPIN